MTLSERQSNESDSNPQSTVEDLQVKLDAALNRIRQQESIIAGFEAKMNAWKDLEESTKSAVQELNLFKAALERKSKETSLLQQGLQAKKDHDMVMAIISAFIIILFFTFA